MRGAMTVIRQYEISDWEQVWDILRPVFRAGETYAFPMDISEEDACHAWTKVPRHVFVAVDSDTRHILGTYYLKPNYSGPGSHVCNCGYVVSPAARGRGIATRMCLHSQEQAVSVGYRAMQYNLVAASNEGAVRLWSKMGFDTVGTLPRAFRHPTQGFIDAYVMFKSLAWPEEN